MAALIAFSTNKKLGKNHPARRDFIECISFLWQMRYFYEALILGLDEPRIGEKFLWVGYKDYLEWKNLKMLK